MSIPAILVTALGFGLATGLIETGVHLVRKLALGRILAFGMDFVWMTPLANAAVFLLLALVLLLVVVPVKRLRRPEVVYGWFGLALFFGPLLLADRIHRAAALVLALGLAAGLARRLAPNNERITRALRRAVPVLLLAFPLIGAARYAVRGWSERRAVAARPAAAAAAPNVLLLVLDTVRSWNLGLYGYWRPTTPRLARWLERGVVFERALAVAPWTAPSHASMFTGLEPTGLSANWDTPLDDRSRTLAELFRDHGYATGGFVGNYRYAGNATGLGRGFDHFDDYPVSLEQVLRSAQLSARSFTLGTVAEQLGKRRLIQGGKDAVEVNTEFLTWLESQPEGRPFFAFLNYFDAHAPYTPPPPWDSTFAGRDPETVNRYWQRMEEVFGPGPLPRQFLQETQDAYDGGIAYLDHQIDSLLTQLESRGLLQNTVVIITSDHGEHFGEHGLIQHGNSLFLPLLHVPLAIYAPARFPAGVRVQAAVSLRDLAATIVDLAGLSAGSLPGRSLGEWFRPATGGPLRADTLFAAVDYHRQLPKWPVSPVLRGDMRSLVLDSLHYIRNGDGAEELFHLGRDSRETRNLAGLPEFQPDLLRHRRALEKVRTRE